jgi:hypothetical protein
MTKQDGYTLTFISDQRSRGGQHTNGPDFGLFRCEHDETRTAVEIHSVQTRNAHAARELAIVLCTMAVEELDKR